MTISIAEAILQGSLRLRKAGVPEARREAGSLVAHALGRDRSFIITHAEDQIGGEQAERFRDWLERRANGEPLQYITGNQGFFGLDFEVNRDVLIPRPETELLVETALKLARLHNATLICDVGTGSGCVVISLLHELRETARARAVAIDVSAAALEVARRNAAHHTVDDRIEFVISDCFSALNPQDPAPRFDLIVSNPPYISDGELSGLQREVRNFEPRAALAGGADGLTVIRRLLAESLPFLKSGGYFLFEIGYDQGTMVQQLLDPKMWRLIEIYEDLQGIPRTVALQKIS